MQKIAIETWIQFGGNVIGGAFAGAIAIFLWYREKNRVELKATADILSHAKSIEKYTFHEINTIYGEVRSSFNILNHCISIGRTPECDFSRLRVMLKDISSQFERDLLRENPKITEGKIVYLSENVVDLIVYVRSEIFEIVRAFQEVRSDATRNGARKEDLIEMLDELAVQMKNLILRIEGILEAT